MKSLEPDGTQNFNPINCGVHMLSQYNYPITTLSDHSIIIISNNHVFVSIIKSLYWSGGPV